MDKKTKKLLKIEELYDFKDRMAFVIQSYFTSKAEASEKLELSQQMVSGLTKGKTKPSLDTILQIHRLIPALNLHWLITGTGEFLIDAKKDDGQIIEEPIVPYGKTNQQLQAELNECKAQLQITTDIISKGLANQNHETQKK